MATIKQFPELKGGTYNLICLVNDRLCLRRKSYCLKSLIDKPVFGRPCIIIAVVILIITGQLLDFVFCKPEELVIDVPFLSIKFYLT